MYNPLTKERLNLMVQSIKNIAKIYNKKKNDDNKIDNYLNFRKNRIDPILFEELPFRGYDESSLFKFEFKWNPYTGEEI